MKRVNLDPNADYVGNGPPKKPDARIIRKFSDRHPMLGCDPDENDEAAELEIARKAQLEEKERSRAEHQKLEEASAAAKRKKR